MIICAMNYRRWFSRNLMSATAAPLAVTQSGGHGALIMALKNPGKYTSVSAFAPIVNPCSVPWGIKAFSSYLGEDKNAWLEWDSCALMYASNAQDAIPTLIDQGDNDQFLADQLQPAVLAEAARHESVADDAAYSAGI